MIKHTPGPWTVETPMGDDLPWIVEADRPSNEWRCIAQISLEEDDGDFSRGEAEANLRLMCAAPDLLQAIKALLPKAWRGGDTMDHMPGVKLARLAIAKAEGRS